MPDYMIREPTRRDLARLREIYLDSRRTTFHWNPPESYRLADFDTDTEGERVLVAECDGVVAGFVSVWVPDNFVHHVYLDSAFKRRGIGKALLHAALALLEGPARLKCVVRNTAAVAFYTRLGWRVLETSEGNDGPYYLMQSPE